MQLSERTLAQIKNATEAKTGAGVSTGSSRTATLTTSEQAGIKERVQKAITQKNQGTTYRNEYVTQRAESPTERAERAKQERAKTVRSAMEAADTAEKEYDDFIHSEEYATIQDLKRLQQMYDQSGITLYTGYSPIAENQLNAREKELKTKAEKLRQTANQYRMEDIMSDIDNLAAQAEQEYQGYIHSEEYVAWKMARDEAVAEQERIIAQVGIPIGIPTYLEQDDRERELAATAEYYRQLATSKKESEMMNADLEELASWPVEDQQALMLYATGKYQDMLASPEQLSMINADAQARGLFQKYGEQKVREMAESYMRSQNQQAAQSVTQAAQESAGSGFWAGTGHSIASVGANLVGGLTSPLGYLAESTQHTGRYSTLDPNNAGMLPGIYAGAVRGKVAENIENAGFGKAGSTVYQASMSALDNLARVITFGKTGSLALAATGSFGQSVSQYSSQGATPLEAVGMGIISGGLEVITEKVSLDNLLDDIGGSSKNAMEILKDMFIQGGIEVSEEELSFLGSTLAEAAVLREKSSYNQRVAELQAYGFTRSQAKEQASLGVWEEAAQTAIQSFLSGSMMSGVTDVYSNTQIRQQERASDKQLKDTVDQAAQQIQEGGTVQRGESSVLIQPGLDVGEDVRKQAERISGATGRQIVFYSSDTGEDGYYADEMIFVNSKGVDPVAQIISHELTHSVEMADAYKEISTLVMNRIRQTGGNVEQLRKQKQELYSQKGIQLESQEQIDSEIVASYVAQHLLTDEQSITSLAQENPKLGQRILNWIDDLLAKLGNTGAQERTFLRKARDAYARALDQTRGTAPSQAEVTGSDTSLQDVKAWADEQYRTGVWSEEEYDAFLDEYQQWEEQNGIDSMSQKKYSFAGVNAKNADMDTLQQAKELQEQGVDNETIRQRTGWFRGMDGKQRFEIDDSQMQISDDISNYMRLGELMQHDALYDAYPDLADIDVVFQSLDAGVNGSYHPQFDSINLSYKLKNDPVGLKDALVHELQHAIQQREGFTKGATVESWERKKKAGFDSRRVEDIRKAQETERELRRIQEEEPEFYRDMVELDAMTPDLPRGEIDWETLEKIEDDPVEWQQYDARREELEAKYGDTKVWDMNDLLYQREQAAKNVGRSGVELYFDTAGEIEARDASNRRSKTAEQRKSSPPRLGNEDTVFAEGNAPADDYIPGDVAESELENGINEVAVMSPISAISGTEFTSEGRTLLDDVARFFKSVGGQVYNSRLGDINLTRRGVKDSLAHGMTPQKAASFAAIPDILRDGKVVGFEKNWKQRGYDSATIAAPITIGGEEYLMAVIVHRSNSANRFYVHDVFTTKKEATPFMTGTQNLGEPGGATSTISIIRKILDVKINKYELGKKYSHRDTVSISNNRVSQEAQSVNANSGGKQFSISDQQNAEDNNADSENARSSLNVKARNYLERTERSLLNHIGEALGVPYHAKRDSLKPIIQEISDEYLRSGRVSDDTVNRLFDKAYDEGIVVDREFYDQYKDIKKHLQSVAVTISQQDRADIADFQDFRRRAWGTLRIVKDGGLPVDSAYQELTTMAPELFPEDITHPADQLQRMFDVGQSIRVSEKSLDDYHREDAEEFRSWAKNDFSAAIGNAISDLRTVKRYAESHYTEMEDAEEITLDQAEQLWADLKQARRTYEKANAKNLLTPQDEMQVGRLLRGEVLLEHLEGEENYKGIKAVFEAKQEHEQISSLLGRFKRQIRAKNLQLADDYLETAIKWKDKRTGIAYSRETMRRNIFDIVPDTELANRIVEEYFEPVHTAEAKSTRFKTEYRDRVRALDLSTKVEKGNLVSEAHAVQLLGESMDNIRVLENTRGRMKTRDGKTLSEWQDVVNNLWAENPNLNKTKVESAVQEFRTIYDELFQKMNRVRMENGYEPVNYRQGYFPHFQPGDGDGIMQYFGRALGIDTNVDALPTTINGLTHTFKPGIQWFGNAQERLGFNTAYDAVEGFDKYIEGVSSVIHQTESIQKLRAFATQARYRTSDEGIKKQVDAVLADVRLTEEEKQMKIRDIYEHGKYTLSNFVAELDEYTNLLANKKSKHDRSMEALMGRRAYTIMKNIESRVGANMIAGNLSSAFTNFIPLTQAWGRISSANLLKGMRDTARAVIHKDGSIVGQSDFLTNRRGSDVLVQSWADKLSNFLGTPMEVIDNVVSESIVRGAYYQNLNRGMSESEAMHQADIFAASVMADRSKGSMPTLFESSNPLFKAFTQFQLEVNNQYSEIFKDIPREYKDKSKWMLAASLFKYFIAAFLFNELEEKIKGRRSALDPIGVATDFIEDWKQVGISEAGANMVVNLAEGLPFASALSLAGVDIDGGRVPVSSAMPDIPALWEAATDSDMNGKQRWKTASEELMKPVTYLLLPGGGNQAQKIWKGIDAYIRGGSYGLDQEGNEVLQYPVYKDDGGDAFWNLVKSMMFGKNSLQTAQDWVEDSFGSLDKYQTVVYQDMLDAGVTDRDAFELVDRLRNIPKSTEENGAEIQRRNQQEVLLDSDISDEGKAIAFYGMVATDSEKELINNLTDAGADAGSIIEFVIDFKDADYLKGTEKKEYLRDTIAESKLTEEEKIVAVGDILGTETTNEKGNPTQYAKFLNALNEGLSVDQYMDLYANNVSVDDYLELVDNGMSSDGAVDLALELAGLEPLEGKTSVSWEQECDVILDAGLNEADQVAALEMVSYESTGRKIRIGYENGLAPSALIDLKRILPDYDANGNGSYSQAEVTAAINAMAGNEVWLALTDGKTSLTNEQKAVLWQLQTNAKNGKSNPYDKEIGQYIYNIIQERKAAAEQEEGDVDTQAQQTQAESSGTGNRYLDAWWGLK